MKTIAIALVTAGCASTPAPISQTEYDDVARSVGGSTALVGGDAGAMTSSLLLARGMVPAGLAQGSGGAFLGTYAGLDVAYTLRCPDQESTTPICTPTADLADVDLAWSGALVLPSFEATVVHHGQWALAHLRSPAIVLAGTGTFSYDSSTYHLDYASAYTHVVLDPVTQLAIGGTIDYEITADHLVGAGNSFAIDAQVTIHPDATVTFVLDGTHPYVANLLTGEVTVVSPI